MLATVGCLAAAGGAWAYSFNYLTSAPLGAGETGYTCCQAARQFNKLWRPSGNHFCLAYGSVSCVDDTFSNPFTDTRTAFYDYAICWNLSGHTVYPVTCQTTHP